jgi:hypothetical protein
MLFRNILLLSSLLISVSAFADKNKENDKDKIKSIIQKHKPNPDCIFDVIPLNSPVKESEARFLIKTPDRFDIDEVSYQVKNSGRIFEKPKSHQKINLIDGPDGKELRINVSKLPPGFYQLLVRLKDKSNKEYNFKTKFKDHAMFVIDQTLEVPMPDPKKNDATVAGIDSENDGIRDDIQRWINEEFNSQPKVKAAMKQVAMSRQLDLLSVDDKVKSIFSGKKYLDDRTCLKFIVGLDERIRLTREFESKILNTKDRLYAEVKANANFSGQAWDSPGSSDEEKALCNFDPDNF